MISFGLSDEEKLISRTAEEFSRVLYDGMRKWEKEGLSEDVVKKYDEIGFRYIDLPAELGGHQMNFFTKTIVLEKLASGCAGATIYLEFPTLNLHLIKNAELDKNEINEIKEKCLTWGVYVDFDGNFKEEEGNISGKAPCVIGKKTDKFALVKDGKVYLIGEFDVQNKKPLALDAAGVNEIKVNMAKPEKEFQLKDKGRYFISVARLYLSAILTGVLRSSFEYASRYAQEREAFGKKIAHHQGLAFILSDFSIAVSSCQIYTWKAAWSLDINQEDYFRQCADAFAFTAETAEKFTVWGVQILGGHGFVKDHPVEKWMREAKAISLLFGGKHYAQLDSEEYI